MRNPLIFRFFRVIFISNLQDQFVEFFSLNRGKFLAIFFGVGVCVFAKIMSNLAEIIEDPITKQRKLVYCNFKAGFWSFSSFSPL